MFTPKYFYSRYSTPKYWANSGQYGDARIVQIASLAAVRSLGVLPQRVNYVLLQAEGQNIRYRDDGIAPSAGIGLILYAGAAPTKFAGAVELLKFIEVAGGAKLNVRYY